MEFHNQKTKQKKKKNVREKTLVVVTKVCA